MKVPVFEFVINLLIAAILAYILGLLYVRFAATLSNRKKLANDFILITMTTMIVITIVKSSLALSLGLVGALSIVRFRAAIKEPTELGYLFFAIAIGLGCGADQRVITIVGFLIISSIIVIKSRTCRSYPVNNFYLNVTSHGENELKLESIVEILKQYSISVELRRYDESKDVLEASFMVEYDSFEKMRESKNALRKFDDSVNISFMENRGIIN